VGVNSCHVWLSCASPRWQLGPVRDQMVPALQGTLWCMLGYCRAKGT
jgi:hypothetical protein